MLNERKRQVNLQAGLARLIIIIVASQYQLLKPSLLLLLPFPLKSKHKLRTVVKNSQTEEMMIPFQEFSPAFLLLFFVFCNGKNSTYLSLQPFDQPCLGNLQHSAVEPVLNHPWQLLQTELLLCSVKR